MRVLAGLVCRWHPLRPASRRRQACAPDFFCGVINEHAVGCACVSPLQSAAFVRRIQLAPEPPAARPCAGAVAANGARIGMPNNILSILISRTL